MHQKYSYPPLQKMYVFGRGWHFLRDETRQLLSMATKSSSYLFGLTSLLFAKGKKMFLLFGLCAWVLSLGIALLGIVLFCLVALVALVFTIVYTSVLLVSMASCLLLIGVITLSSRFYTRYFGIHYRCPNVYCYHEMPTPVFLCKQCKEPHSALQPGIYGIFYQRCTCGSKVPTLDRLGRDTIDRYCTDCRAPLDKEIGRGTNIDIPIIGGRSAGKTTYLIAAISMLKAQYKDHTISFTNEQYRRQFEESLHKLQQKQMVRATVDEAPHAYSLAFIRPGARVPKLLFFYDAAGESFTKNEKMYLHSYYNYIRGMIFIIDPGAISAFKRMHSTEIESLRHGIFPSELNVEEIGHRLVYNIEMRRGVRQFKPHKIPLAVIVTKVDALGLEDEIGSAVVQRWLERTSFACTQEEAMHIVVREFLCQYGLNNLTEQLERCFSPVRYFSCSSLGTIPLSSGYHFAPMRVLEPLQWLLSQNDVF